MSRAGIGGAGEDAMDLHKGVDEDVPGDSRQDDELQQHQREHSSSRPDVMMAIMGPY
jgi:hypothetical protein